MSSLVGESVVGAPIAVIGMSCRLPRAENPDQFWRLLVDGIDAVTEAPAERWPDLAATEHRRGGFIADVDRFDAAFFGISPNEAAAMDPQQRLTLELAWEALERARIAPTALRGTQVGVFVGAINADYTNLQDRLGADALGQYTFTGTHRSLIANRVSYHLGLRGPSLTLDAGQSSSLVAVQLACDELRRGGAELALAGGVNLNLLEQTSAVIGRFGALSADGRCFTFDSRANGYVRGEGGAVVVLKPLAAALADGDPVHCVILGGAVNNDGGGDGLTVPNGQAQQEVIELACQRAGVSPAQVGYVELHGTGTPVGDPIEAAALGAALGADRDAPLLVGSVKTNIGHLEGAAGIAGLLKVVLSISNGGLAPNLNFEVANPAIPLDELNLRVVEQTQTWPGGRRIAGVSSFGVGGTNCHLVLAEAPEPTRQATESLSSHTAPLVLSARSGPALRAQAAAMSAHLVGSDHRIADIALSLVDTRARFDHRAVVFGADRAELCAGLDTIGAGRIDRSVVTGHGVAGGVAFVFPGQGSQWPGMAADLIDEYPAFAARLSECDAALAPFVDFTVTDVLRGASGAPGLDRVDVVQPVLWAVMVALAELWRSTGVTPDTVIGHSQGEIAAATVVGALSLNDAARVVAIRSQAIRRITGGGMMSVGAPAHVVTEMLARFPGAGIAAENGPHSVVVSGATDALAALKSTLDAGGYRTKVLPVDYASHSATVDPLRDELLAALAPIRPRSTGVRFISTVTGEPVDTTCLDAEYWFRSLREPVRFADAVRHALDTGTGLFIEASPHPVLVGSIEETIDAADVDAVVVGTLRRDESGPDRFTHCLAEAFVGGADVGWSDRFAGGRRVDLPTYPFQRDRHWIGTAAPRALATPAPTPAAEAPKQSVAGRSRRDLRELVAATTADILGHADGSAIDAALPFKALGVDSVSAVELRNRVKALTGLRVPTTVLFDHPTPNRLAEHLHTLLAAPDTATATVEAAAGDPIAIVGMGCRLPGGITSPDELWRLLADGTDAISELPTNRGWDLDTLLGSDDEPGTCATRFGGFLHDADTFDAAFFGLSPREALAMDPQQPLLETSWSAFEHAGIDPAGLAGSATGVFVGAMAADYGPRLHHPTGVVDGHLLTGTLPSVASGRIAYILDTRGPAITVDTACSSSLVAIQLATEALRRDECSLAIAGGVTVMANPGLLVEFSRQNGLAVDGRAKAFGAAADGTTFSEGAGVLLLERLSDARRNGHQVLAVIRGVATNSDGASNGLSAPNGAAQRRVIQAALADARLAPDEVDAVEAHGTGTALGDPIEASALLATYGQDRAAHPLLLGSVKSNIGHTQAAAGVAGVIKMVMALRHGVLPATLHADQPSDKIDWASGQVALLTESTDGPVTARPRRAAVSSFGISGTNAHVVIEAAEQAEEQPGEPAEVLVWVLSAKSAASLTMQAERLAEFARAATDADLAAAGPNLAAKPSYPHRAVVVAADREELCAALSALADGTIHPALTTGHAGTERDAVFVFPGQGAQWVGMATELLAGNETFAGHLRRCADAIAVHTGWSVLDVLTEADGAPTLEGTDVVQPVLFALNVSLALTWRSIGVDPVAVVGHSQGEIAAACVAGALSLEDAAKIVSLRSKVLSVLDGTGGVLSVALPVAEVAPRLAAWPDRLWVAVDNGPTGTVIAGDLAAMDEFVAAWDGSASLKRTPVKYAAHTPHVAAVHDQLLAALGELSPRDTDTAICSSCTGDFIDGSALVTEYWYRNLAEQVSFDTAIRAFADRRHPLFIEVSPHPILAGAVKDILADAGVDADALGTLRRGEGGFHRFAMAAAQAYVAGAGVAWPRLVGPVGRRVDLPGYAFDRRRFWLPGTERRGHPLVDAVRVADNGGVLLTGRLSVTSTPWLAHHEVGGTVLLPGTAFVELAATAAAACGADVVEDLTLAAPLVLPSRGAVLVQLAVGADEDGKRGLTVHSRPADDPDATWTKHATGTVSGDPGAHQGVEGVAIPRPAQAQPVDLIDAYATLEAAGYAYGPAFRGLTAAWRDGADRYAEVRLPEPGADGFVIHPALLDAALHVLVLDQLADGPGLLLPFSWSGVRLRATTSDRLQVALRDLGDNTVALTIHDGTGALIGEIDALTLRQASMASAPADLHRLDWVPTSLAGADLGAQRWAVVGTDPLAETIATAVRADGISAPLYYDLASMADTVRELPSVVLVPVRPDETDHPRYAVRDGLSEAVDLVQQWLADDRFAESRLVFLADHGALRSAPIWGLLRSAITEHPDRFGVSDVDTSAPGAWALLAAALLAGEPQALITSDTLSLPRVAKAAPMDATEDFGDGTVLITGGTSGIGALVAERLVRRHGAKNLLLVSREGARKAGAAELEQRLTELGATVRIAACDVADRAAVTTLLAAVEPPLIAVMHAAGVLADTPVTGLTAERLDPVLRAKVDAGWVLHELTADLPLRAFVLFSSVAGVLGTAGQGNYAAGNAFLDALAGHRRDLGLPAVSIAWGLWSMPTGLTGALSQADLARWSAIGVIPLDVERGLDLFDAAIRPGVEATVVASTWDTRGLRAKAAAGTEINAVLRALVPAAVRSAVPAAAVAAVAAPGSTGLSGRLAAVDRIQAHTMLSTLVRTHVATALGHASADAVDPGQPFSDMGFDSLTSVELRNRLGAETGMRLPPTLVFNHPTVADVVDYLLGELVPPLPDPDRVLADAVDAVIAALAAPGADSAQRIKVEAVLHAAMVRVGGNGDGPSQSALLGAASDEEIFQFIDQL
ncbi:MAG TPA: type I polyketide synthase [Actinokineospora sp.]|nr:type I polyketide synthase [Actinokineospora sp.]